MCVYGRLESLTGTQLARALSRMNSDRLRIPPAAMADMYSQICHRGSREQLGSMSSRELSMFAPAFGFLVKQWWKKADHVKFSQHLVSRAAELVSAASPKESRDLVKGIALLRVPLSEALINFFRSVRIEGMSKDEQVYVLRAGIDYGLLNTSLMYTLIGDKQNLSASSARSLLYCCAMAGCDVVSHVGSRLLELSEIISHDMKSLIALWSASVLGITIDTNNPAIRHLLEKGKASSDPRDRTMTAYITGQAAESTRVLSQSTKHLKLLPRLDARYGKLILEYSIGSGITVDCANPETRIAIEIHGPSHYLVDLHTGDRRLNGPSRAKEARIEALGWSVTNFDVMNNRTVSVA